MQGLFVLILQVGGAALYFYTIFLAYTLSGIIAAIVSAMFPGVSNLYWIYERWSVTGEFMNFYTQMNILWLVIYVISILFLGVSATLMSKKNDLD